MERLIRLHAHTGDKEAWLNPRYIREIISEGDSTRISIHVNYPPPSRTTGTSRPSGSVLHVKEPASQIARKINQMK